MQSRKARCSRLKRLARFEQCRKAQPLSANEDTDRALNRGAPRPPDDRAAIAPGPRFEESPRFGWPSELRPMHGFVNVGVVKLQMIQVDRDHESLTNWLQALVPRVRPPLCRELQSVYLYIVRYVVSGRKATGNVNMVVLPTKEVIFPEVEILLCRVACNS